MGAGSRGRRLFSLDATATRCYFSLATGFTIDREDCPYGEEGTGRMPLDILFRQVPEGFEFVGVLLTILGSLGIMVLLGSWWSR